MTEAALFNDKNKRRPATTSESVRQGILRQWQTHKRDRQLERKFAFKSLRRKYLQDIIKLLLENSQKRSPFVRKT